MLWKTILCCVALENHFELCGRQGGDLHIAPGPHVVLLLQSHCCPVEVNPGGIYIDIGEIILSEDSEKKKLAPLKFHKKL